jgi:hypothetical protein
MPKFTPPPAQDKSLIPYSGVYLETFNRIYFSPYPPSAAARVQVDIGKKRDRLSHSSDSKEIKKLAIEILQMETAVKDAGSSLSIKNQERNNGFRNRSNTINF